MPFPAGLLGAHVANRPLGPRARAEILVSQRQTEIGDHRFAAGVDEDVRRLDVSVHHAVEMGVVQGLGDQRHQLSGLLSCDALAADPRRQVAPVHVLRDDVAAAVLRAAEVVDGNNPGMIQFGDCPGLAEIHVDVAGASDAVRMGDLHGHRPVEFLVVREIDLPESALPHRAAQPISPDRISAKGISVPLPCAWFVTIR